MRFYKFMSNGEVVITDDKTGAKLPPGRKWKFMGETRMDAGDGPKIGANSSEIVDGVKRDGYFVWPVKKQKPPK